MAPSIDQLPLDIYYPIVECLSPTDNRGTLYSLMFTSKDWFRAAEARFYHTFRHWNNANESQKGFFESVANAPRRAKHIRVATFSFRSDRLPPSATDILQSMTNLTVLECWTVETSYLTPISECRFPQLKEFAFDVENAEAELIPFLSAHPLLEKLTLNWAKIVPAPSDILPNLETVGGTLELYHQFCVGRPIKRFDQILAFPRAVVMEHLTGGPFKNMEVLAVGDCPESVMYFIPDLFPNLKKLFLGIVQDADTVMQTVTNLPQLQRISLVAPSFVLLALQPKIITMLMKHKTLDCVDITAGTDDASFDRYVRGSVDPVRLTFDEIYDSF